MRTHSPGLGAENRAPSFNQRETGNALGERNAAPGSFRCLHALVPLDREVPFWDIYGRDRIPTVQERVYNLTTV